MEKYKIRKATINDLSFIADVIIAAEKGFSNNLSFSTLFDLKEAKVKELIMDMLAEEIDGCEFSISSFLVTEFDGEPVAAYGAWIEGFGENPPSKILKSNLINFTFPIENIKKLIARSEIVKDILIEREMLTLQYEYLYVAEKHRGNKLANNLENKLLERAIAEYPELKKCQFQMFGNNLHVIRLFERLGYSITKSAKSDNREILNYLPYNVKLLLEKKITI